MDDLISRRDAIRAVMTDVRTERTECLFHANMICKRIEDLPSAEAGEIYRSGYKDGKKRGKKEQKRRKGKWVNNLHDIPICNQCGYMTPYDRAIDDYEYGNFCPNCGADMRKTDV